MQPKTYHKIIFQDTRAELVEEVLPEPGENQVVIKTRCSLISPGTEKAAINRVWDDPAFRANPGYALVGDIIAAGPNPVGLSAGDRVVSLVNHADYILASADPWVTLKIPDRVSDEEAAFLPLASVALHAVRRAQIGLGEPFVVIGLGIIGQIAVQLAKMQGAQKVIAIDLADNRLALAQVNGADVTINPSQQDMAAAVMAETQGQGAPVILDSTGNTRVIPQTFKMAAVGGRVVVVGIINEEVSMNFYREFMQRELSLIAARQPSCPTVETTYWRWTQQANRRLLLDMMAAGKLNVSSLLTHRFSTENVPEIYEHIRQADAEMLGVLLEWQ